MRLPGEVEVDAYWPAVGMTGATEASDVVELRDVRGPSALGGGTKRFFELLYLISVTEFKKTYFGTVLGYFWSLLRPLLTFAVLLFVFTQIFKLGGARSSTPHYPEMLLFDIVLFGLFAEATGGAVASVVGQRGDRPQDAVPAARHPALDRLHVALQLRDEHDRRGHLPDRLRSRPDVDLALLPGHRPRGLRSRFGPRPAALDPLRALPRRRDHLGVISTALLYGTPVIYPLQNPPVPDQYHQLLLVNPLTPIFVQARTLDHRQQRPRRADDRGRLGAPSPAIAIYVGVCVLGVWIFSRDAPRVAEEL